MCLPRLTIIPLLCVALGAAGATRYALLVGSNAGGGNREQLRYAEEDARRFSQLLTALGGFNRENVTTLLRPDSAVFARALAVADSAAHAAPGARENGLFLLYYSGHADNTDLLPGNAAGFPLKRIQTFLDTMPMAMRIGVFDACNSGAVTAMKGGARAEPFYFKTQQTAKGEVIIASSAVNEQSQESESLKGSVFSHHWLNGLRGSADVSGDRMVTVNEAYQYAYLKTIETTALTGGGVQHPVYRFNILGQGDIVLTNLARNSGGVVLDKSCEGKFLVLSDDYRAVYADFSKKRGSELTIALPAGGYTAINGMGRVVTMRSFAVAGSAPYRLAAGDLTEQPLTIERVKGANPSAARALSAMPLSRYSAGFGIAGLFLPRTTVANGNRGLACAWVNRVYVAESADLFFDVSAVLPGANAGGDAGIDYVSRRTGPAFFAGIGAGLYYFTKQHQGFNECFGPALTAHAGFSMDVGGRTRAQVLVPYTMVFNRGYDQMTGVELRLVWDGAFANVRALPAQ